MPVKVLERRAKLLGLDALPKADVSTPIQFTLDLGTLGEHIEAD
jgi:hypothetical protein